MEKKGLLKIFKGANGGYKLNKEPHLYSPKTLFKELECNLVPENI